jgi:hypothetical protein
MPILSTRWTTTRWILPSKIRAERYAQLHGSSKYNVIFDQKFLEGLERRRDLLESRNYKLMALQAPLFLLLAFGLLDLDVKVSIAGFSIEGVRGLRELLLTISSVLGVASSALSRQIGDVTEILKAATMKMSGGQREVNNLLNVRYGLEELASPHVFDQSLSTGRGYILALSAAAVPALLVVIAAVGVALAVQFLTLREIWLHPNFSSIVSVAVIAFVVSADLTTFAHYWLQRWLQPLQTDADFKKLTKLEWKDRAKYDAIIKEIAVQHARRGFFSKLLFRPHMPRLK